MSETQFQKFDKDNDTSDFIEVANEMEYLPLYNEIKNDQFK